MPSIRKGNKSEKNKKSRERYKARQVKGKIKRYNIDIQNGDRSVINLSSHEMTMAEIFALHMGYGFIPTPTHQLKEEETLILEGLRFVDRIGKLDVKLRDEQLRDSLDGEGSGANSNNDTSNGNNNGHNHAQDTVPHTDFQPIQFKRSKDIPFILQAYRMYE